MATMIGWQPIETAPKDGTPILASNGYRIEVIDWGETSLWSDRKTNKGMDWCVGECDGEYNSRHTFDCPTHWMPMPDPPIGPTA